MRASLILPMLVSVLATAAIAQPLPGNAIQHSYSQTNVETAVLVASNLRIDTLTQAIERYPENAALYNSRGWYSFWDGDYAQSASDYSQVIALGIENIDPIYHTSVYHVRGLAYAELGETALALESLQVAAQMYREQGDALGQQEVETAIERIGE